MKHPWRYVTSALVIVILAGGAYLYQHHKLPGQTGPAKPAVAQQAAYTVRAGSIRTSVSGTGSTAALQDQTLSFGAAGRIAQVMVTEGEHVTAGEALATLDDTQDQLALLKAEQTYKTDQINGSPNALAQDKLNVQVAQDSLDKTTLKAPFDGVVTNLTQQAGDSVSAGTAIMRLINPDNYEVDVNIDETDISKVKVGQMTAITLDAYPGARFTGKVTAIGYAPTGSNGVVLFPTKVAFDRSDPRLRPGLTAEVEITVAEAQDVPVIPVEAITDVGGRQLVSKVTPDGTQRVPVETGLSDGLMVQVTSGLSVGDQIVSNNYQLYQRIFGGTPSDVAAQANGRGGRGGFGGGGNFAFSAAGRAIGGAARGGGGRAR